MAIISKFGFQKNIRLYAFCLFIIIIMPACFCGRNGLWHAEITVLDAKTGKPVPDAKVTFSKVEILLNESDSDYKDHVYTTPRNGRFSARFKASNYVDEVEATIEHPAYKTEKSNILRKQNAVIRLTPK